MKILIGTLLLTLAVVINIGDLSALGNEAGPSRLPEPSDTHLTPPTPRKPNWVFYYNGREVGVWLDFGGKVEAVGFVSGNVILDLKERFKLGILTHMEHEQGIFFLVHTLPDGSIVGIENVAKYNNYPSVQLRGATRTIDFNSRRIYVWEDRNGNAYFVSLEGRNIIPTAFERAEYQIQDNLVHQGNMSFWAYSLHSGYPVGVLLELKG